MQPDKAGTAPAFRLDNYAGTRMHSTAVVYYWEEADAYVAALTIWDERAEAAEANRRYFAGLRVFGKQRKAESDELFNRSIPYPEALTLAGPELFGVRWLPLSSLDEMILGIGPTHPEYSGAFRHHQEQQGQIQWLERLFLRNDLVVEVRGARRVLQRELEAVIEQRSSNPSTREPAASAGEAQIERTRPPAGGPSHTASHGTGPRPHKREKIKAAMLDDLKSGKTTTSQLREDTEEVLTATYGVSRETCRLARVAALAEFSEITNSDK